MAKVLLKEYITRRALPKNLAENEHFLFSHELEKTIPGSVIEHLEGMIINSKGWIFKNFTISPFSFIPLEEKMSRSLLFKTRAFLETFNFLKSRKAVDQPVVWITDPWSNGYFHWFMDALPRLFAYLDVEQKPCTVLLPQVCKKPPYIAQSLDLMPDVRYEFIAPNQLVQANKLFIPTQLALTGNYHDEIIRKMNGHFQKVKATGTSADPDKIYISRFKAGKRKILNEDELLPVLHSYGFTVVNLEDISWQGQLHLFQHAKYLVSIHGGGLTNMLFMPQGSKVFELRRKNDNENNCYYSLACALGFDYYYQTCDSDSENTFDANLKVDIKSFKQYLERFLA